jgi:hypothetical protein
MVEASVASPVEERPGLRRVVTGWTGQGSVPATGVGNQVRFVLDAISSLTWNWRTEVRFSAAAMAGGRVEGGGEQWLAEGTNVVVRAIADPGQVFIGWSGDFASSDSELKLVLARPVAVVAHFAPSVDNDALPDEWERRELGGLEKGADGDEDRDGRSNLDEYRMGTDPNHREVESISLGLESRWENVQRDPALPGQLVVRDFGAGFRGVWENSNDFREAVDGRFIGAENTVPGVSFEGPRLVIRTNVWEPGWRDFTARTVFSVGDNDGNCVYFRYQDERNWYRVTVCGENNNLDWRAPFGVTIQKRTAGVFTELAEDASIATDPSDASFYKRVQVAVTARGADFEVRVSGWNASATPPGWDLARELVLTFSDTDHANGRFGVGTWGQSGGGPATASNPVNAGVLIEDVVVESGGREVFREEWQQVPLAAELPVGWQPATTGASAGTWQVTAHGGILQTANFSTPSTGTVTEPRADGDGSILLAPALTSPNQALSFVFHPFDDDGIGFVYDFADTNNFARVLFVSEPTANGRIPQGVNVSRRMGGAWTNIFVANTDFVYRNGVPFSVDFAHRDGSYRMMARDLDDPSRTRSWSWADVSVGQGRRFGLSVWGETDAHFLRASAAELPVMQTSGSPRIAKVTVSGGVLTLDLADLGGVAYAVERADALSSSGWVTVAEGQTTAVWSMALPAGSSAGFLRIRQSR